MGEHGPHVGWKFFELGAQWVQIEVELPIILVCSTLVLGTFSYHNLLLFYFVFFLVMKIY
jgi:hypothetical protein